MKQTIDGFSELQTVTKAVGFLAILTGVLYVRAMVGEGAVGLGESVEGNGKPSSTAPHFSSPAASS